MGKYEKRHASRLDAALVLLRAVAAIAFFYHGSQKLFGWFGGGGLSGFASYLENLQIPLPYVAACLAAASEVAGALILLAGRAFWALAPLVFTMLVAALTSGRHGYDVQHGGAEYPMTMVVLLIALVLTGPGSLVAIRPSQGGAR
ncbi:DoxX family protein [Pendulispora brunnea]|uniref:DoxX family protein n=1 Tax=Pendulispora brunnea TaxID=2905690 RepID=A0ABZ2KCI7_9BACT